MLYQVPVWVCAFLRMGTVGFVAQAAGREDGDALRGMLVQALLLSLALALIGMAGLALALQPALDVMQPSAELRVFATQYLHVRLFGLPAALGNYALMGWFLGGQDARVPMRILIVTNVTNIALNLLFVLGWGWGVPGIALASVLGEWIGLVSG
ncbi:MAG: MATE family efflux transporter, partial [Xanthomonadales bacterium]|nr:MATE family efflux transporter [Xanthomonadales bacterium]